jgi:hypothetical protein
MQKYDRWENGISLNNSVFLEIFNGHTILGPNACCRNPLSMQTTGVRMLSMLTGKENIKKYVAKYVDFTNMNFL